MDSVISVMLSQPDCSVSLKSTFSECQLHVHNGKLGSYYVALAGLNSLSR